MSTLTFLGKGWNVPLQPDDRNGKLNYESGAEKVRQSIWIILDTEPGERIMRPSFGCGLRRYLMKPNTTATRTLLQREVTSALKAWEPRIELQSVLVTPGDDPSLVLIEIVYLHRRDGQKGNLVYPFYLEP
ncbi:MAG TPA: GPW/gp25 family protein [Pyrinomonadaceae bacterium]|jgi:phage baseplate assembly protein W|nr:GPW/gp25 family protein [Pyrinomonadaceae bacterium]